MRNLKFAKKYAALGIAAVILIGVIGTALIVGGADSKPKKPGSTAQASACGPYRNDLTVQIKGHQFKTELAKTADERTKGLAGRPCILADQAMLFSFSQPGRYPFWMKDMKFPIDVIWIGSDYKVAAIERDFQPSSYPEQRANGLPAQYVLEVKANLTKQYGIGLGTPATL